MISGSVVEAAGERLDRPEQLIGPVAGRLRRQALGLQGSQQSHDRGLGQAGARDAVRAGSRSGRRFSACSRSMARSTERMLSRFAAFDPWPMTESEGVLIACSPLSETLFRCAKVRVGYPYMQRPYMRVPPSEKL